jgi:cytochrome b
MTAASHTTSIRPTTSAHSRPRLVVVWDPVVRLFHWLVVAGFMANMFVAEEGKLVHRWIGYGILALIVVRLVWGFVGTAYARFSNFVPTRTAFWRYVSALSAGPLYRAQSRCCRHDDHARAPARFLRNHGLDARTRCILGQ